MGSQIVNARGTIALMRSTERNITDQRQTNLFPLTIALREPIFLGRGATKLQRAKTWVVAGRALVINDVN